MFAQLLIVIEGITSWCGQYLVLSGDVAFVPVLYLFELVLKTFELDFHLLHKLQVSLSPLVQNLD